MVTKIVNFRVEASQYRKFKEILGNERGRVAKEFRNHIASVVKEPEKARRRVEVMEFLRAYREVSTAFEEWALKKLYPICSKCGKYKMPGKDVVELFELGARDMIKKSCLCVK